MRSVVTRGDQHWFDLPVALDLGHPDVGDQRVAQALASDRVGEIAALLQVVVHRL